MKIIMAVFLFFPMLLQISTCNPGCICGRQCYAWRNDSIIICQTTYADAAQFTKSADSLNQVYGMGTPFFADSVTVTGNSANARKSIANQLEKQGYTCDCTN